VSVVLSRPALEALRRNFEANGATDRAIASCRHSEVASDAFEAMESMVARGELFEIVTPRRPLLQWPTQPSSTGAVLAPRTRKRTRSGLSGSKKPTPRTRAFELFLSFELFPNTTATSPQPPSVLGCLGDICVEDCQRRQPIGTTKLTTKPRCGPARPVRHPQRCGEKGSASSAARFDDERFEVRQIRQILVGRKMRGANILLLNVYLHSCSTCIMYPDSLITRTHAAAFLSPSHSSPTMARSAAPDDGALSCSPPPLSCSPPPPSL
jgi:hypothetical protein